jgi:hypothetical protein
VLAEGGLQATTAVLKEAIGSFSGLLVDQFTAVSKWLWLYLGTIVT